MIAKVSEDLDVFSIDDKNELKSAVDAVMEGKITLLRVGSVFSFVLNPNIDGLTDKFNLLKERDARQTMSVVCSYEQAKQIVDRKRVNKDFFSISPYICSRVIVRIPIETTQTLPFPYNPKEGTMQFISFEESNPIRNSFREELAARGCEYISITSGNLHGAPTIDELESAKMLAALFNLKASFLGMPDVQTVVTENPSDESAHRGSYIILSFCNPDAVEVKRLANKTDKEFTVGYLKELLADVQLQTPLTYVCEAEF